MSLGESTEVPSPAGMLKEEEELQRKLTDVARTKASCKLEPVDTEGGGAGRWVDGGAEVAALASTAQVAQRKLSMALARNRSAKRAEAEYGAALQELSGVVAAVRAVMARGLFPVNKYTRWRASRSGSSLHSPALVKLVQSRFTEKRIWRKRTGGGRRQHTLVLAVDVSASMGGSLLRNSLFCAGLLRQAAEELGVEVGLVAFADRARVLKSPKEDMAPGAVAGMLAMAGEELQRSDDAAGLRAALSLAGPASRKHSKMVVVLTDGYSSEPRALASELRRAEATGVKVLGLAVGASHAVVQQTYAWGATCPSLWQLADSMKSWLSADAGDAAVADDSSWYKKLQRDAASVSSDSIKELFSAENRVFTDLAKRLTTERELVIGCAKSAASLNSVDVCLCVDTTRTMKPWMDRVMRYLRRIKRGVKRRVQGSMGIGTTLRWSLVTYKDIMGRTDEPDWHLTALDFTKDVESVVRAIGMIEAGNGFKRRGDFEVDTPEDVAGGLGKALEQSWSARTKILLHIADAPPHCKDPGGPFGDGYYHEYADLYERCEHGRRDPQELLREMAERRIQYVFTRIDDKTDRMIERFKEAYDSPLQKVKVLNLAAEVARTQRQLDELFVASIEEAIVAAISQFM